MINLKQVTIHKFKCIESDQAFDVDPDVTVLVGMNESGKTSILQALAKTRYFTKDASFRFNTTHDFPRKEKKRMDKSGIVPKAVTCTYGIDDVLLSQISEEIGPDVFTSTDIVQHVKYDNTTVWTPPTVNIDTFIT
ncbi:MAG: AAA family ATPase [Desulfosarcinaceae bacterium]